MIARASNIINRQNNNTNINTNKKGNVNSFDSLFGPKKN